MKTEEVKIYASIKFPIDGVQYAMGEIGGSWSYGEDGGDIDMAKLKLQISENIKSLMSDAEEQLKSRSKFIIDELVNKGVTEYETQMNKRLQLARQEYLKLKKENEKLTNRLKTTKLNSK
jgi:hypothetical protein